MIFKPLVGFFGGEDISPIPTDTEVYYPFSGNANDASGNGYNGTVYGATLTTDRKSNPNSAYAFVLASNEYIDIPGYPGILGSNSRSISVWVKTSDVSQQTIFSWGSGGSLGGEMFFTVEDNLIGVRVAGGFKLFTATNVNNGSWHHLVFTFGGTNVTDFNAYMDNVSLSLDSQVSRAINTVDNTDSEIGRRIYTSDREFNGDLDDIRLYERVLTTDEINALYNE